MESGRRMVKIIFDKEDASYERDKESRQKRNGTEKNNEEKRNWFEHWLLINAY